jgi:hypothetical protein
MRDIVRETEERRENGARAHKEHDSDLCMLCHAYGADKRSLFVDCFYAIEEAVPEALDVREVEGIPDGYYLRICKSCRGALLGHLQEWRNERVARRSVPKDDDGGDAYDWPDATIPVRVRGAVVMMTPGQFEDHRAARAAEGERHD